MLLLINLHVGNIHVHVHEISLTHCKWIFGGLPLSFYSPCVFH